LAVDARIDRLALGHTGDCKPIGQSVFEMRIHFGPGYRVYFAYDGASVILLLAGGNKATQDRDIRLAKQYFEDYLQRRRGKS